MRSSTNYAVYVEQKQTIIISILHIGNMCRFWLLLLVLVLLRIAFQRLMHLLIFPYVIMYLCRFLFRIKIEIEIENELAF